MVLLLGEQNSIERLLKGIGHSSTYEQFIRISDLEELNVYLMHRKLDDDFDYDITFGAKELLSNAVEHGGGIRTLREHHGNEGAAIEVVQSIPYDYESLARIAIEKEKLEGYEAFETVRHNGLIMLHRFPAITVASDGIRTFVAKPYALPTASARHHNKIPDLGHVLAGR